jgi:hypothetical protein
LEETTTTESDEITTDMDGNTSEVEDHDEITDPEITEQAIEPLYFGSPTP